ncbi:hypothetical protein FEM48_Zijuj10G0091200 [Ziziphus jujuba var. spinosa]|uniref:Uncharacterized protein n=1 Tax=Ziziphus jujuba var. spinosa TaxID=714518 RepID=A0A978UMH7_ZIZJJ|nr:hypothetical protein FEM48_Zijuj10G0091200 [Ziziphus jujuba var. spinosa]
MEQPESTLSASLHFPMETQISCDHTPPRYDLCSINDTIVLDPTISTFFVAGGYIGNFFHDFNDGFIPLFITINTIFHDRDDVIVVSEAPDWWLVKPGLIFIQIVPIGVEWASDVFFGRVARGLMLQYFEYKIRKEESNLIERYGKDNILVNDPFAAQKQGWDTKVMDIYLKEQNVNLDLVRFKGHMKEAYKKAKKFISKND